MMLQATRAESDPVTPKVLTVVCDMKIGELKHEALDSKIS